MSIAEQVESLWNGLGDSSGNPLSFGKVYTYQAGTSTLVNLYATQDKASAAPNPILLDSIGRALVYADGSYKFIVEDEFDVTQYTMDNLTYGGGGGGAGGGSAVSHWGGLSTGSSNNFSISPSPGIASYVAGERFTFIAHQTITGPAFLSVNGLAAVPIRRGPAASNLGAGDIQAGNIVDVLYDATTGGRFLPTNGTDFLLHLNPANQALLAPATVLTNPAGLSMNVNTADGADTGHQSFGHAGDVRGAYLSLFGNEAATSGGCAIIAAGDVANGVIWLRNRGMQPIWFTTSDYVRWQIEPNGNFLPGTDLAYDVGSTTKRVKDIHLSGELYKPVGTWTPTITAGGAGGPMTITNVVPSSGDYCRIGPFMFIRLNVTFNLGGTASNEMFFTLPMAAAVVDPINTSFGCSVDDGGGVPVTNGGRWRIANAGQAIVFKPSVAPFTIGVNAAININGFYRVA